MTDQANPTVLNTTRRQFAAIGMVAATAAATGFSATANAAPLPVAARAVAGVSVATLFAPELGEHPGLVMFASPAASRAANAVVAKELAGQGWSVLLVDPPLGDEQQINRTAKAHTALLARQAGVAKAESGYSLRSFAAAPPAFSLPGRRAGARSAVLFALPAIAAKSDARRESLHKAARALQNLAA